MKLYLFLPLLILLSVPQASAQHYQGKASEIDKILSAVKQFSAHVMAGDHAKIAACYTANGKIFPNNLDIIEGTEALDSYWKRPEGIQITYHKITPSEIKIIGKEAYDYGYYEGTTKKANGEEVSWRGKYVVIWKKEKGDWKIYLDIWNSIKE